MLDLYLIRHAESERNLEPHIVSGRSSDSPLSALGREQSWLLGRRFVQQQVHFDKIYSSTAVRDRDSAVLVGKEMGYSLEDIIFSDQLIELSQGAWEGQPRVQIYTPETLAQINADNWNFTPPGGESQRMVEERMLQFIQTQILPQHPENFTYGIFTHGVAIKCLLRGIMDFTSKITYKIVLDNTSITRLQYDECGWHLLSVNDTAHLFGAHTK